MGQWIRSFHATKPHCDDRSFQYITEWRRFENSIQKAIESCKQSGNDPSHHFAGAGKQINLGKGAIQTINDYHLSRFAYYLIAQNGDSRKPEGESDSITWEELAKDRIAKYKKSGLALRGARYHKITELTN